MTREQEIFSAAFKMIREAKNIIMVDIFLFSDYMNHDRYFTDSSGN